MAAGSLRLLRKIKGAVRLPSRPRWPRRSAAYDRGISFFDSPPEPPGRPSRPSQHRIPAWAGPPQDVSPGIVALELFLVHTDRHAWWIDHADVYPEGLALEVHLRGREEAPEGVEAGPGSWRFGVQFSDGRKATIYGLGIFARDARRPVNPGGDVNVSRAGNIGRRRANWLAVAARSAGPSGTRWRR